MSSNNNHIIPVLTRTNYEEYFLLYVDNELTLDQKKAVDAFVLLHPDLKEELDLLGATKLPADAVIFDQKETLLADSMKVNTVDEALLLYIDNELAAPEIEKVETQLKSDATFALQHALLLKTKLTPEEIQYPNKKELYRRTRWGIVPTWLRVAAAVVVLAGAGTVAWLSNGSTSYAEPDIAVITNKNIPQQTAPEPKQFENPITGEPTKAGAVTEKKSPAKKELQEQQSVLTPVAKNAAKKAQRKTISEPHIEPTDVIVSNNLPVVKKTDATLQTDVAEKTPKPALNNSVVTSEKAAAYVSIDAAAKTTVPVEAVAFETEPERRGGSMKGLLRKAARFIERRTGIKTVNDDDELLVGAVALKL